MPDSNPGRDPLATLAARVHDDLHRIAHPRMKWLQPRIGPDGAPALDVLVVGAGQSGLAIGVGLLRAQVDNILLVDRAEPGAEGPWLSYARMRTLRSPKDYTGPDLDLPSLGYQSWHEARYGPAHWQALDLIAREDWASYLAWVRDTVGVPVQQPHAPSSTSPPPADLLAATFADGTIRPHPQTRPRHWAGRHGRVVDAPLRRRPAPRPTAPTPPTRSTSPPCAAAGSPCSVPAPRPSTTPPWHSRPGPPMSRSTAAGRNHRSCNPTAG